MVKPGTSALPEPTTAAAERPVADIIVELDRVVLFGLPFVSAASERLVADVILAHGARCADQELPVVVTPNVDHLVRLSKNPPPTELDVCTRAAYVLPDGQPVITASKLIGKPLESRLAGSTLFQELWPDVVAEHRPCILVAPRQTVADRLVRQHGQAEAIVPPIFAPTDHGAIDDIADQILAAAGRVRPEFIFVGLGNPKQSLIVGRVLERWTDDLGPVPLFFCIGASLEMEAGLVKRAPAWMQARGLEWFYRFVKEPRRLFRRYFIDDLSFVPLVWREWRATSRA